MMLSPDTRKALQDPQARELLQAELQALLDGVNATLEDHEKLDYLVVVKDAWTSDNGFLTPTMKIKRNIIEDRYLAKAQRWSELGRTVILETD